MNNEQRIKALGIISIRQQHCGSVLVEIGGVSEDSQVEHSTLYVVDCPAVIIDALLKAGYSLSMCHGKLLVEHY